MLAVKIRVLILIALLAVPLFCAGAFLREVIMADSALDSGASFDYTAFSPDQTQNHPYTSFSERHGPLLLASGVSFAGALIYTGYVTSRRLRRRAI